jgi:hypothetical protein
MSETFYVYCRTTPPHYYASPQDIIKDTEIISSSIENLIENLKKKFSAEQLLNLLNNQYTGMVVLNFEKECINNLLIKKI